MTPGDMGRMGPILPSALMLVADNRKSSSQRKLPPPCSCLPFPRGTDTALNYPSSAFSSMKNGGNLNCSGFWGAVSPPHSECGQRAETAEEQQCCLSLLQHCGPSDPRSYGSTTVSISQVRLESSPKGRRGASAHLADGFGQG